MRRRRVAAVLGGWVLLTVMGLGGCGSLSRCLWNARREKPVGPPVAAVQADGRMLLELPCETRTLRFRVDVDALEGQPRSGAVQAVSAREPLPVSVCAVSVLFDGTWSDFGPGGVPVMLIWPSAAHRGSYAFSLAGGSSRPSVKQELQVKLPIRWDGAAVLSLLASAPAAAGDLVLTPIKGIVNAFGAISVGCRSSDPLDFCDD